MSDLAIIAVTLIGTAVAASLIVGAIVWCATHIGDQ
jgi:hypothetical protein